MPFATSSPVTAKKWYEKPPGILLLAIVGGLIVAFIAYKLGWV